MTLSYWHRDARIGAIPPKPLATRSDFVVIGGGFAGFSTALALRELHPAAVITVLEAATLGSGASGRNAGFLSPVAAPVWLLSAEPERAWAARALAKRVRDLADWMRALDCELRPAPLRIEASGRLNGAGLREFAAALARAGIDHALEDSNNRRLGLAMSASAMHPVKLMSALAGQAADADIAIHENCPVRRIDKTRVITNESSIVADSIVVCTNAYSASLDLDERIWALPIHSHMIASSPIDIGELRDRADQFTVELGGAEAYHRAHGDRLIYGGVDKILATERDGPVSPRICARLSASLHKSYPELDGVGVSHAWSGVFHATPTGLPIIRRSRQNPAITLNVGYGGTGVALSLAFGRLAAAVASNMSPPSDPDARLLEALSSTTLPVRDSLRAAGRVLRRLISR